MPILLKTNQKFIKSKFKCLMNIYYRNKFRQKYRVEKKCFYVIYFYMNSKITLFPFLRNIQFPREIECTSTTYNIVQTINPLIMLRKIH